MKFLFIFLLLFSGLNVAIGQGCCQGDCNCGRCTIPVPVMDSLGRIIRIECQPIPYCDCHPKDCPPPPSSGPEVVSSIDPNDIVPPSSVGPEGWIRRERELEFMIRFENDPDSATAAAQVVEVYYPFPPKADVGSFKLGDFGFGPFYFMGPKTGNRQQLVDTLYVADTTGVNVAIEAGIDTVNSWAYWKFISLDTSTNMPTMDPLAGFLPVNDTLVGDGEGFVIFSIKPKSNSVTFDELDSYANIYFDTNDPLMTNIALNTVDADPPESAVLDTFSAPNASNLRVQWSGTDVGCGVKNYTILYSVNDSTYRPWIELTTATAGLLPAKLGNTYRFLSIARDSVENTEQKTTYDVEVTFTEDLIDKDAAPLCDSLEITIPYDAVLMPGDLHAARTLTATNIIGTGNNVVYTAGDSIRLLAGFTVEPGANFHAFILECDPGAILAEAVPEAEADSLGLTSQKTPGLRIIPNPTTNSTNFYFSLPEPAPTRLDVFDMTGRRQSIVLPTQELTPGAYRFGYSTENLQGGVYIVVLQIGKEKLVEKLVVIR